MWGLGWWKQLEPAIFPQPIIIIILFHCAIKCICVWLRFSRLEGEREWVTECMMERGGRQREKINQSMCWWLCISLSSNVTKSSVNPFFFLFQPPHKNPAIIPPSTKDLAHAGNGSSLQKYSSPRVELDYLDVSFLMIRNDHNCGELFLASHCHKDSGRQRHTRTLLWGKKLLLLTSCFIDSEGWRNIISPIITAEVTAIKFVKYLNSIC